MSTAPQPINPLTRPTAAVPTSGPAPSFTGPSFARLSVAELRKATDTRGGRWFLALLALLVVGALGFRVLTPADGPTSFGYVYGTPAGVLQQLLPVLAILVMTTEWTQRSALSTFTLTPRRGRVLAAKLTAVVAMAVGSALLLAAVAVPATLLAGALSGDPVDWAGTSGLIAGAAASITLAMLLGAAIGALVQQTAGALVVFFLAPVLVALAADEVLGQNIAWVLIRLTLADVAALDLTAGVVPALTSVMLWIVVPLAVGVLRTLRREVG